MKATCKVVKSVFSEDGQRKETVAAGMTVAKAIALRDKLDAKQERLDMQAGTRTVVSYTVEGTVAPAYIGPNPGYGSNG
jgi:hypothetical protein